MSSPVARFAPSRKFLLLACAALAGTAGSAVMAWHWPLVWIATGLFALTSAGLLVLFGQPVIEIHESHLQVGNRSISWTDIQRVDQTNWKSPLALYLALAGDNRLLLLYPGKGDACIALLRLVRRYSREALLDGVSYRQFWGEPAPVERRQLPPPRYPLLRPEDEADVERMFQRLKTVGHIDQRGTADQHTGDDQ